MALQAKLLRGVLALIFLCAAGACPKKDVKKDKPGPDPDTNSGPDAKRGGARVIAPKRDLNDSYKLLFVETDSVSWPKLQRTKWKRLDLERPGAQNVLDCELRIDNTGADLNIDIFNSLGTQIGFSPGPAPNKLKKLAVPIEEPGTYFVRVQAAQPKDESDFSVLCVWEEKAPEVAEPAKEPDKERRRRPRAERPQPAAKEETLEDKIEKGVEGRIVQAYREGGRMKLNLDKGSAAGVKVGTEGHILSGRSGRQPLEGGAFRVVKVIDDTHSVGESEVRSVGKNNRVVFFVK
ncbi:MAG: hypothetical protein RMK29_16175 [Myxococcales bacterium]|nr:hypothetical protein [Myxococcota bacterium]MDW8283254.1 hypothetical protein [Myxococcales bacterium]